MGATSYIGISSKARKVKKMYIGIGGKAREIKKAWIGVGGKARLIYSAGWDSSNIIRGILDYTTDAGATWTHNMSVTTSNTRAFVDQTTYLGGYYLTVRNNPSYNSGYYTISLVYEYFTPSSTTSTIVTKTLTNYSSGYYPQAKGYGKPLIDADGNFIFVYRTGNTAGTLYYYKFTSPTSYTSGSWGSFSISGYTGHECLLSYCNGYFYAVVNDTSLYYSTSVGGSWTLLKTFSDSTYTYNQVINLSAPALDEILVIQRGRSYEGYGRTYSYKLRGTTLTSLGEMKFPVWPSTSDKRGSTSIDSLIKFKGVWMCRYGSGSYGTSDYNDLHWYAYSTDGVNWIRAKDGSDSDSNYGTPSDKQDYCATCNADKAFIKEYYSTDGKTLTSCGGSFNVAFPMVCAVPGGYTRH